MSNPFLQAVIANPDDDLTRLVYADWLDENGQSERAEFVRVQVALAAGEPDVTRRRRLEDRQRELLVAHDREWVNELAAVLECPPGRWGGWVFRRGFVEYFHLPSRVVVRHGAALAQLTPVRELYLNPTAPEDLPALSRMSWLAGVRDLYLVTALNHICAEALVLSPFVTGLRKLVVRVNEDVEADARLMARFEERFRGVWQV